MYAEHICWISGPSAPTTSYNYYSGTDLGIPVETAIASLANAGNITEGTYTKPLLLFGDTNGPSYTKIADNMIARLDPYDPSPSAYALPLTGSTLNIPVNQLSDIQAKLNFDTQAIPRDRTPGESSCIPTSGMSVEMAPLQGLQTTVASYMSVVQFDGGGLWRTNYGGFAFSRDGGVTWSKPSRSKWYNNSNWTDQWQMVTLARRNQFDRYLYMFGTQNGRFGPAKLARVEQDRLLDVSAYPSPYRYWDGSSWVKEKNRAVDVIPAPVGEMGIMWHEYSQQWLMGYLNENKAAIVIRTAPDIIGPWSDENIVATGSAFPQLYGCFFFNRTSFYPAPYFTMSQFGPYNVRLMRLNL